MANTSPSNPAAEVGVRRSARTKTGKRGSKAVAVPPNESNTTTTRTERQRVNRSLHKAPPETMPTLVVLQPPAQPPFGPPPPYPRRANRTPSQNPPALLAIFPLAPLGDAVSPLDYMSTSLPPLSACYPDDVVETATRTLAFGDNPSARDEEPAVP